MITYQKYKTTTDYGDLPAGTCVRVKLTTKSYHYGQASIMAATVEVKVPISICAPFLNQKTPCTS